MLNRCLLFYDSCHHSFRLFHTVASFHFAKSGQLGELLTKMPKVNKPDHVKLRHIRFRERIKKLPIPSTIEVQVVGSGGRGTPRAVMVGTDHSRYLFNCGEGTQRIAFEHKMKLSKLENIFITHKSWENIGGLLGMALTLDSTFVPEINIHGPPGVEAITKMVRAFADAATVKLEKKELNQGYFEDFALRIDYVTLHRNKTSRSAAASQSQSDRPENKEEATSEEPETKKRRLSSEESHIAVAYICRPHQLPRKVSLERCVEVGIKPGPILGRIKAGETVTLENGTVVHPDQILDPVEVQPPFLIVECPDEEFLQPLTSSPQLQELSNTGTVQLIIHMSPPHILETDHYQQWMNSFGTETQHMIINSTTSEISQLGLYEIQTHLNLVHPRVFPLLPHLTTPVTQENTDPHDTQVKGCTNLRYIFRPKKGINRDQCFHLDREAVVQEASKLPNVEELMENLKSNLKQEESQGPKYPEIVFLGTGSSMPSKTRNASGIVLNLSEDTTLLMDCGEGTAGQLYRHYGDHTDDILRKLKAVFISHLHADHHLGLFNVLAERREAFRKSGEACPQLLLLAPIQISRWLNFYTHEVEPVTNQLRLISLQSVLGHQQETNTDLVQLVSSTLHLSDFLPVEVQHCKNAFGIALVHQTGWKIVYSGDTMPCERLVIAGKGCDLLIHEATMEDDLEEEAKFKKHSTTSQAIDIGVRMGAKFILLTHFSQRYAKLPVLSDKFTSKVGISFDNMRVSLSDLPLLPHFNTLLKALFAEHYTEMVNKQEKRTLRKTLMKEIMEERRTSTTVKSREEAITPETSKTAEIETSSVVST